MLSIYFWSVKLLCKILKGTSFLLTRVFQEFVLHHAVITHDMGDVGTQFSVKWACHHGSVTSLLYYITESTRAHFDTRERG